MEVHKHHHLPYNNKTDVYILNGLRGALLGTKMAPPYSIVFMEDLEEQILHNCHFKPLSWWKYISNSFLLQQNEEGNLKEFWNTLTTIT